MASRRKLVRYHFTTQENLQSILEDGIRPYDISRHRDLRWIVEKAGVTFGLGIFLWPKVTESLLADFYFWKRSQGWGGGMGIAIRCLVRPQHLLSRLGQDALCDGDSLKLTHWLRINGREVHSVRMDLGLQAIPPEDLQLHAHAAMVVERVKRGRELVIP